METGETRIVIKMHQRVYKIIKLFWGRGSNTPDLGPLRSLPWSSEKGVEETKGTGRDKKEEKRGRKKRKEKKKGEEVWKGGICGIIAYHYLPGLNRVN